MRNRIWLAAGGSVLAASISLLGAATAASASTASTSTVVGYTYLDGNTAGANTIDGFARHADGSVTPLPGSPFTAGGAGLGTGLASQGAIQATPDGRYLLAVDAGSNQISVLRITTGGVPVPVGQPVSSGGIKPVSVAVSPAGLVYVANSGAGGSGYSGFRLHADGSLTPVPGSTVTVPDSAGLGDVFFNAFGNHLVGTRTGTSQIDSFVVLPGGHLLAAKGSPFTGQGLGQLGAEFSPANPSQLFVSNAHNGTGLGTVSAYRDSLFGQLTPVGASPYADGQTAPCWVEISRDGKDLFVTNTASGNISSYAINPGGSLTLIGTTAIKGGGADIDERLSPDGKYLLVDGSGNHILSVFAVNGGTLTEVASSPTPLPGKSYVRRSAPAKRHRLRSRTATMEAQLSSTEVRVSGEFVDGQDDVPDTALQDPGRGGVSGHRRPHRVQRVTVEELIQGCGLRAWRDAHAGTRPAVPLARR